MLSTSRGGRGQGAQGNAAQVTVTAHQCLTWALTVTNAAPTAGPRHPRPLCPQVSPVRLYLVRNLLFFSRLLVFFNYVSRARVL